MKCALFVLLFRFFLNNKLVAFGFNFLYKNTKIEWLKNYAHRFLRETIGSFPWELDWFIYLFILNFHVSVKPKQNMCYPNQEFKIEFGAISEVSVRDFKEKNWLNSTEISNFKRVVGAKAAINIYNELQCSMSKWKTKPYKA